MLFISFHLFEMRSNGPAMQNRISESEKKKIDEKKSPTPEFASSDGKNLPAKCCCSRAKSPKVSAEERIILIPTYVLKYKVER